MAVFASLLQQFLPFLSNCGAFIQLLRSNSLPSWLINMRKCLAILPDAKFKGRDPFNQISVTESNIWNGNLKKFGNSGDFLFHWSHHFVRYSAPVFYGIKKFHSRFLNKFAIISTHLVCVMWPNYPVETRMTLTRRNCFESA